jgi:hypothetical protein
MSDDNLRNQPMTDHDGYEHQDLGPTGVFYFMAGLVVFTIIIYVIVFGMYRFLNSYETAHQPAMSPMVGRPADTRAVTSEETQNFPQPRLEVNERTQLQQVVEDQDRKLATYNWVDKDKGTVQIPIGRAMDLIVERGLPVYSAAAAEQSSRKQKSKAPATKPAEDGN